ncbi:MAG: NAD-dependent epimerase/dehydratase family protein [Thermoleophilia bacterium]
MSTDAFPSKILVTGAAGYVGGALVRKLLARPDTHVIGVDWTRMPHGAEGVRELLGEPRLEFHRADVRDLDAIRPLLAGADAVVHLAAIVGDPAGKRDPDLTRDINVTASKRLVEEASAAGVGHFIFVSTCSNYGVSDTDALVTEDADLNPVSLYAETKVAVEEFLREQANGLGYTALRLATVYGVAPRMRFDLTVNQFTIEAYRDGALSIFGEQFWRPYAHVDDIARAIVMVLAAPRKSRNQTFNVGDSGENYTKRMMYELLKERLPGLRAEWTTVDEDPRSYKVSFDKIRETLGYQVTKRVPDGMDEILERARLGVYPDASAERFRN